MQRRRRCSERLSDWVGPGVGWVALSKEMFWLFLCWSWMGEGYPESELGWAGSESFIFCWWCPGWQGSHITNISNCQHQGAHGLLFPWTPIRRSLGCSVHLWNLFWVSVMKVVVSSLGVISNWLHLCLKSFPVPFKMFSPHHWRLYQHEVCHPHEYPWSLTVNNVISKHNARPPGTRGASSAWLLSWLPGRDRHQHPPGEPGSCPRLFTGQEDGTVSTANLKSYCEGEVKILFCIDLFLSP